MIDREKVIDGLEYMITAYAFSAEEAQWLGDAMELLKEQESVVRCKDCKIGTKIKQNGKCTMVMCYEEYHDPYWFCADGERR